jgi:hypothetical protein
MYSASCPQRLAAANSYSAGRKRTVVKSLGVTNRRIKRVVNKMAETKIEMRSITRYN